MLGNLGGWTWVIILLIVLLLFGAPKLPALAKSIGQSMKIFRNEIRTPEAESTAPDAASAPQARVTPTTDEQAAELRAAELRLAELRAAEAASRPGDTSPKS